MYDLIKEWDEDGNAQISRKEFHKVAMFMGREHLTNEESGRLFKRIDEDGAGSITSAEMERTLTKASGKGARACPFASLQLPLCTCPAPRCASHCPG